MSRSRRPTKKAVLEPTVVLLGATPVLVEACRRAAAAVGSARLEVCDTTSIVAKAAEKRPFALVVSEKYYETDASELEALARDVGAELVCVSAANTSVLTLERELQPVFEEAFRKRSGATA